MTTTMTVSLNNDDETKTTPRNTYPPTSLLTIQAECGSCRKAGRSNKVPHGMLLNFDG